MRINTDKRGLGSSAISNVEKFVYIRENQCPIFIFGIAAIEEKPLTATRLFVTLSTMNMYDEQNHRPHSIRERVGQGILRYVAGSIPAAALPN